MESRPQYRFARRIVAGLVLASAALVGVATQPADAVPTVYNGEIVFMHMSDTHEFESGKTIWPDGTHQQAVQVGAHPVYSPDGSQIASLENGGIALTPSAGGEPVVKLLSEGGGFSMAYSPDGSSVAWPDDDGIVIAALDGSSRVVLFGDDENQEFSPAFLPDGRIVYEDYVDDEFSIWIADLDGSNASLVLTPARSHHGLDVSPDGQWIVFGDPGGVRLVRINGTEDHTIPATSAVTARFSPDGQWIVFAQDETDPGIYVVKTDGTGMRRVTTGNDIYPDWRRVSAPLNHAPIPRIALKQLNPHYVVVSAATSTDADGSIVSYQWRWGDGSTPSNTKQAWHQYNRSGWALLRLTVTDDKGASTTRGVWTYIA